MKNNLDEDSLKRLNLIIEKTKAYDDCVFPVGTYREFGSLYISDLKKALSELETYKKIAEKLAEQLRWLPIGDGATDFIQFKKVEEAIDWARKEVENDTKNKK